MRRYIGIIGALILGFALAMLSMAIAIYVGYSQAYAGGVSVKEVYVFGLNIYEITKSGQVYIGTSIGKNMGIVCAVYMVIVLAVEEIIRKLRRL